MEEEVINREGMEDSKEARDTLHSKAILSKAIPNSNREVILSRYAKP